MSLRFPETTIENTTLKILVIDDDEDDYVIAREMLKDARGRKFDVHWASTYAEGREELASDHYHAVLVDYDLGLHSGIDLIREAAENGYAAPLILFTGRGSYEIDLEAMEAGATMYLTKGEVSPLLMERSIRYAIEIKQRENDLREARETAERELAERRRVEEALRRIDARWNAAIESFNEGVIIATEDEQVIYWNPAAREMHGFTTPDEGIEPLEQTPVTFQLWTPDGSHLLELDEWPMRRIKRGEEVRELELRIRRPDQGWEKVFSYSGVMVDTSGGERLIFLTCRDLTEKRRVEDALRESEERLRLALDTARMVVWEYDPATLQVIFSENAEEVLELPRRHENSNQGYGLIHPDDVEKHRALVTKAIASGGSYVSEYRHPHPDKVIWLEEHGQAKVDQAGRTVRLVGVVQNITGRKQAEADLRQSEEKYAKSFRSSPAAIAISTVAEGRFTEVNDRFLEIFGYSREEMIGHTSVELGFYPDPAERNGILRLLREEGRFRDYEIAMLNRNGEPRDLLFSGERIEIEGQDYLLALIMDITERKQAEAALTASTEALRASEQKFSTLFQKAAFAAILGTLPDATIVDVNEAWEKLYGYTQAEATGKTVPELNLVVDHEQRQRMLAELMRNGFVHDFEMVIRRKTGDLRTLRINFDVIEIGGKQYSLNTSYDITEQRRAELALQESRSRLVDFVENIHNNYIALDQEWCFTYANRHYGSVMGMDPQALIGKNYWELFPQYVGTQLEQNYRKVMAEKVPLHYTQGGIYTDHQYEVSIFPTTEGIAVFSIDRTEELRRQQQVENERARLRFFIDADIVGVMMHREDGTLIEANHYYLELIGRTRQELEAGLLNWRSITPAEYRSFDDQSMAELKASSVSPAYEKEYFRSDGSRVWVLVRRARLPDGTYAVFAFDMSERKQAEKALAETAEKLARSNHELEEFAFVASHDLQEPLRKVVLFGNSLRHQLSGVLDETAADYLDRMQGAARRMQDMIDGLLELSRVNAQNRAFAPVDLGRVVAEVVTDLDEQISAAGGQVITGELPTINADELQMRQLFQNLIGNAIKFHKPGEPPEVRISQRVNKGKPSPWVEIQLADNGIGFDPQDAGHIFQPFQRLHGRAEFHGTGLGLSICQKIVERHHGTITVESTPGQGSVFTVRLPDQRK